MTGTSCADCDHCERIDVRVLNFGYLCQLNKPKTALIVQAGKAVYAKDILPNTVEEEVDASDFRLYISRPLDVTCEHFCPPSEVNESEVINE